MTRTRAHRTIATLCILSIALVSGVSADNATAIHATASSSCPEPVKGRNFDDDLLSLAVLLEDILNAETFHCSFKAENRDSGKENNGQRGVKGTGSGRFLNSSGNTIGTFNWPIKTDNSGYDSFGVNPDFFPGLAGFTVDVNLKGSKRLNRARVSCGLGNVPACEPDGTTLCLGQDGRFKVSVTWEDLQGDTGSGEVLQRQNNQGAFYFFNPNNTDLVVQLLDACKQNDSFWVFYAATTNFEYDLTVTDTATGEVRTYGNDLGVASLAITDTSAFATCP